MWPTPANVLVKNCDSWQQLYNTLENAIHRIIKCAYLHTNEVTNNVYSSANLAQDMCLQITATMTQLPSVKSCILLQITHQEKNALMMVTSFQTPD
jgi:hypothetical protein